MRCEEFESRLNEILDRRRNPRSDAELWLHATSCPECGDVLEGYQALFVGLKRREAAAAPDDLPARVQLQLSRSRRRGAWRDRAPLALVAAALIVVASLPGLWNIAARTSPDMKATPAVATTLSDVHSGSTTTHSGAPLTVLARMAGDQVRFLAVHSEQSVALAWRLVPSVQDVIEGIEGTAGAPRSPSRPGPEKPENLHNPSAVDSRPSASG